jgi:hypothetical protein
MSCRRTTGLVTRPRDLNWEIWCFCVPGSGADGGLFIRLHPGNIPSPEDFPLIENFLSSKYGGKQRSVSISNVEMEVLARADRAAADDRKI